MKTRHLILSVVLPVLCLFGCKTERISVKEISLDKTSVEIAKGESLQLVLTVNPENARYDKIVWESSDEAVAAVDQKGMVTAVGKGEATVKVSVDDKKAECKVKVVGIPAESIALDKEQITLEKEQTAQLTATVLPEDADDRTVTWSSADKNIATVDDKGLVTAVAAGETKVTASCGNLSAECLVTVEGIAVTSISLDKEELSLAIDETAQLTATVLPEDAENKTVIWSSSDSKIATVDDKGLVTAIAAGNAKVTASCGNVSAECAVTVGGKASESITLDKESISLFEGETSQLTATVLPEDAEDKTVTWSSSDDRVATVDDKGLVTAVAEGNATITAKNTTLSATCAVTVTKKGTSEGPKVGDYYYSDGTYSSSLDESKEVIAIVFYVGHHPADKSDYSATGIGSQKCNAYAVSMGNSGKLLAWGPFLNTVGTAPKNDKGEAYFHDATYMPGRPDLLLDKDTEWNGYESTRMIRNVADSEFSGLNPDNPDGFPATCMAVNYEHAAPSASSGWFLPSTGQMLTAYEVSKSSANFNIDAFKGFDTYNGYAFWTSSEDGYNGQDMWAFILQIENSAAVLSSDYKDSFNCFVRPVIAF